MNEDALLFRRLKEELREEWRSWIEDGDVTMRKGVLEGNSLGGGR